MPNILRFPVWILVVCAEMWAQLAIHVSLGLGKYFDPEPSAVGYIIALTHILLWSSVSAAAGEAILPRR